MTEINKKLGKLTFEEATEKERLIKDLAQDLLEAYRKSTLFKTGKTNKEIEFDSTMGIALFTAHILKAIDSSMGNDGRFYDFYMEHILPSNIEMVKSIYNNPTEQIFS